MKKPTINFVCQECGYDSPSWLGKCPECGSWNSMKEIRVSSASSSLRSRNSVLPVTQTAPRNLSEIGFKMQSRIQTPYQEFNTVLGGGIVLGSVILIAGDPGVGKSTLLLQLALSLAKGDNGGKRDKGDKKEKASVSSVPSDPFVPHKVLYVSGEESVEQVKMRAERIASGQNGQEKKQSDSNDNMFLLSATDTDSIVQQISDLKPALVVIDSIQTIESQNISGLSGSVAQVRYSALQFVRIAKQNNIPIIIVGHVTKEGMVAGPMVLSHMVDTVLFLEGEKFSRTRILRSLKNRFGPVDEVGIFLMEEEGIVEAKSPEQLFLTDNTLDVPGSILVSTLEGSRAFLVELQALAVSSKLPMPRRVVSGIDPRRVELLLAVLQKHIRLPVDAMDIFVNVAGGLKLSDPGIDLGICLAVYSSVNALTLRHTVGIGEVGLLGELRMVSGIDKRIREAQKLGFKSIITAKTHKTLKEVISGIGGKK